MHDHDDDRDKILAFELKAIEKAIQGVSKAIVLSTDKIIEELKKQNQAVGFQFKFGPVTLKESTPSMPAEVTLTNEQKVNATIKPVTSKGKPAAVDGVPTWTVNSGTATLAVAADGMSADVISGDDLGDSVIQIDADADLGAGVQTISDTIIVHVTGAMATSLGLSLGTPVDK